MSSNRFNRRQFLQTVAATSALGVLPRALHAAPKPPNILFILADDLGYGDLSSFGRPDYRTPVLDRFAREGLRLTSVYTAAAVCTPTRAALMTGRYPHRTAIGLTEPLGFGDNSVGLPAGHPTLASLVKKQGYDTALVGKWHLGYLPEHSPITHGFDEFYGILSGGVDYFTHKEPNGKLDLHEGMVTVEQSGYITNLLTDRAITYIKTKRSNPFYLALHYTSPHWPWEGPNDKAWSDSIAAGRRTFTEGGSAKVYGSMMQSLDASVARVLRALHDSGQAGNTLVVFTSDNGGERWSYNWPMTERKASLQEGGIRVPGAVQWPGVITPGRMSDLPIITMDWTTTLVAVAGGTPDPNYPLDGIDLQPLFRGPMTAPSRTLFWRTNAQEAARRGRLKYWHGGTTEALYDVVADPGEHASLIQRLPDDAAALKTAWSEWNATVLPRAPRNPGSGPPL